MDTKKVLAIIFSIIFIGAFTFVLTWGIINFNKVKEGMSGTGVYTEQDLNNAYQDGYDTALKDKEEYIQLIAGYRDTITTLNDNISQLNSQVTNLTNHNKDYTNQVAQLTEQKTSLETQVNNLNIIKTNNEETISSLNTQIINLQNQVTTLTNSGESKDNQIVELNNQISNLQNIVSQLQSANDISNSTIKSLNKQIVNLNSRVVELSNQIISNDNSLSALNEKISQLENSIAYYEQYIANLESNEQVVVTFEFDGSVYNIQIVNKNSKVSVTTPTSTEYCIFNYWEINGEQIDLSSYEFSANTKVLANVTRKYKVRFISDGQSYGENQIIEENCSPIKPDDPVKEKYEFKGWSLDGKEVITNFEEYVITEDVSFIAVYESLVTVTFMNNEDRVDEIKVVNGQISNVPAGPEKENFNFVGWSLNGIDIIDFTTYEIESSIIVTPKYEWIWDGTYKGGGNSYSNSNLVIVADENGEIISFTQAGRTVTLKKNTDGSWQSTKGIPYQGSNYKYCNFKIYRETKTDGTGCFRVSCKASNGSGYDAAGASSITTEYVYKV